MKGLNFPVLFITLLLICGILLTELLQIPLKITILCFGFLFLLALYNWLRPNKNTTILASCPFYLSFLVLGMLLSQLAEPINIPSHFLNVSGTDHNAPIKLRINEVLKPGTYADRYIAEVKTIDNNPVSGKVLVYVSLDSIQQAYGISGQFLVDGIYFTNATIKAVPKPKNPYQFNYAHFLENQGVYGQLSIKYDDLLLLSSTIKTPLGLAASIREFIQQRLDPSNFTPDQWGVINALLLGQRQELTREVSNTYRDAGVIHILAVSGLHVGILLLILQLLLKPLGNSKRQRFWRSLLVIIGIWCFALITGLSSSILRAATMFTFLQIGLTFNRKNGGMNGLFTSALVLLIIDPQLIYQVGFQLSYLAVFFILWLQPELAALWKPRNLVLNYFWDIITVSLAAQLGVLPLSLYYFHQFPGLFLLANIVVLPLLLVILGFGLLIITVAAFSQLPSFLAEAYAKLITWSNSFISWIAHFDGLVIKHIYFNMTWMLLAYLLLTVIILLLKRSNYQRIMLFLGSVLIVVMTLGGEKMVTSTTHLDILYKSKKTILAKSAAAKLTFYSSDTLLNKSEPELINSFIEKKKSKALYFNKLRNIYTVGDQNLLVVDSLGIYNVPGLKPDFILLTQSPKININRLISQYPNTQLIADGSNYKSYLQRWQKTCKKMKIPFYSIYENGYFRIAP